MIIGVLDGASARHLHGGTVFLRKDLYLYLRF